MPTTADTSVTAECETQSKNSQVSCTEIPHLWAQSAELSVHSCLPQDVLVFFLLALYTQ